MDAVQQVDVIAAMSMHQRGAALAALSNLDPEAFADAVAFVFWSDARYATYLAEKDQAA